MVMKFDPKITIPVIRNVLPIITAQDIVRVQPMVVGIETWQSYLHILGNGLNGVSERGEEYIVANAHEYMQIKYPGKYIVEKFYNSEKMTWDLRLKFEDPKEETMWLLRWS